MGGTPALLTLPSLPVRILALIALVSLGELAARAPRAADTLRASRAAARAPAPAPLALTGPLDDWRAHADLRAQTRDLGVGAFFLHPETPPAETFVSPPRAGGARRRGYGRVLAGRDAPMPVDVHVMYLSRSLDASAEKRAACRMTHAAMDLDLFRVASYFALTPPPETPEGTAVRARIAAENATHGDLFFFEAWIPDREISTKVWLEFAHHAARALATYVFKLDDDAVVMWDRFLPELLEHPTQGVFWFRQGTGRQGLYANGPYLFSLDVVRMIAGNADARTGGYEDDWRAQRVVGWLSRCGAPPQSRSRASREGRRAPPSAPRATSAGAPHPAGAQ
jgi:hypothetical protein